VLYNANRIFLKVVSAVGIVERGFAVGKKNVAVILQESVRKCGKFGEVRLVRRGYAHYLERIGAAVLATEKKIAEVQSMLDSLREEDVRRQAQAKEQAQIIEGLQLCFVRVAGGQGRLYGSVSIADLVAEVKKAAGIDLPKSSVSMSPVRVIGSHKTRVHLSDSVEVDLNFHVVEEVDAVGQAVN
jgi:large subunit ribosomal protein L9